MTRNLGNYESLRLGVDLSLPCEPTVAALEKTFEAARKFAEKKLDKLVEEYMPATEKAESVEELDI